MQFFRIANLYLFVYKRDVLVAVPTQLYERLVMGPPQFPDTRLCDAKHCCLHQAKALKLRLSSIRKQTKKSPNLGSHATLQSKKRKLTWSIVFCQILHATQ